MPALDIGRIVGVMVHYLEDILTGDLFPDVVVV